ncbi:class I SAM-dependent methyltransferase [Mesorhizobium sp.]|uniref:class I SAM-dependent methyltransferase n=1 Tax=Mesorhizobium sp. TaxID=1871066 RepID=UPI00257FEEA5|nr:class I SAM-dependent methyltransferase [Mesorhizobium sp.]
MTKQADRAQMACLKADGPTQSTGSIRTDCLVCGQRNLLNSVLFEALPLLCNALCADAASARAAQTGRFATTFCLGCTHVFNASFEENRIGYTQSYENSLHFSPRFVEFVETLAERLSRTYALSGKTIVDIGCGKGDFLKRLSLISGAQGIGFDKSFEDNRGDAVPGVRFINDWFGDSYADLRPDLVVCRQVLEHIAEPVKFLRALRAHPGIGPETVFFFEVPNVLYTLRDMGIWDLIYEHASYFTPASLNAAFETAGFRVLDAGTSFGDQYLYIEARPAAPKYATSVDSREIEMLVRDFERAYRDKIERLGGYIARRNPQQIVVWGGGSKGITFVNVVPGADRIRAIIDVNPHKQGRFAPGTATPILAPEELRGQPVESIIVMNPLYREEITSLVAELGFTPEIAVA